MLGNLVRPYHPKIFLFLALITTATALIVIGLGAYTRLTDSGLGCPDWPGCYGQWFLDHTVSANPTINMKKAWTEMTHRYMAGSLGLLITSLAFFTLRNSNDENSKKVLILPIVLIVLMLFQALLGKWTVTLKLLPSVVMAHLLGGMTTLALLWWLTLTFLPKIKLVQLKYLKKLQRWSLIALTTLSIQILLGGWTSANYAALVCLDFPFCQIPQDFHLDFLETFRLNAEVAGIGEPLTQNARITIQLLHRIGALFTTLTVGGFSALSWIYGKNFLIRALSLLTMFLLITQISLGITNVLMLLPLSIAVAHNFVAALLLLSVITLMYYLHPSHYKSYEHH